MFEIILKLAPAFFSIGAGFALRRFKIIDITTGSQLLKIVLYVTAPCLVIYSSATQNIDREIFALVLGILSINVAGFISSLIYLNYKKITDYKDRGSMLLAGAIINSGFCYAFLQGFYGIDGLSRIAAVEVFGIPILFGLLYPVIVYVSGKQSPSNSQLAQSLKQMLKMPILWAAFVGLVFNVFNIELNKDFANGLQLVGGATGFINAFAVGVLLNITFSKEKLVLVPIIIRYTAGFVVLIAYLFTSNPSVLDAGVMAAIAFSPLGFNSVSLSVIEGFNVSYNTKALGISFVVSLITVPLAIIVFG